MELPADFWDRVAREVAKTIVAEKQAKGMEPEEFAQAMHWQRQMQGRTPQQELNRFRQMQAQI